MTTVRPLVFAPWQPALQHADLVLPNMFEIARKFPWLHLPAMPAAQGLNMAARYLLEHEDYTHLINLDIDHVHPVDVVERLAANVARYPYIKIIGGLNYQRPAPHTPCVWRLPGGVYPDGPEPHIIEISRIGFGCTMVAREVFEEITPPWFMYDYSGMASGIYNYPGPDIFFCAKVAAAGWKIYCDTTVTSPHIAYKLVKGQEENGTVQAKLDRPE